MPEYEDYEEQLTKLKRENKHVKNELTNLQQTYAKLQEYVEELKSNKIPYTEVIDNTKEQDGKLMQYQMLVERCSLLEVANAQLQEDCLAQRQQYEKCLDQVASQVVKALLVQKNQQERCERLTKRVEDLRKQNSCLTSFLAAKSRFQSLRLPFQHGRMPRQLLLCTTNSAVKSQSLPGTLTKSKEANCDTNTFAEEGTSWYSNPTTATNTDTVKDKLSTSSYHSTQFLPALCSSNLAPSRYASLRNHPLNVQSSADACWYDIIKSLQSGDKYPLTGTSTCSDPHNLSTDSSSLDTEDPGIADSQNTLALGIEGVICSSSEVEVTHTISHDQSLNQFEQGIPSSVPSSSSSQTALPCVENNPIIDSAGNCPPSLVETGSFPISLNNQLPIWQNITVNLSRESSPHNDTASFDKEASLPRVVSRDISIDTSTAVVKVKGCGALEGITKDEGYSTMSSDVQSSEVKDISSVCTITTVEEEKTKQVDCDYEAKEGSQIGVLTTNCPPDTIAVEKYSSKNSTWTADSTLAHRPNTRIHEEYIDGLRVVYDEEDTNPDIIFIPISNDDEGKYFRHSFNVPSPDEPFILNRCFSDSDLCKIYVRFPSCHYEKLPAELNSLSNKSVPIRNVPLAKNRNDFYHKFLRKTHVRDGQKCCGRTSVLCPMSMKKESEQNFYVSSQVFPHSVSHPRILSPTYSHAELEDWSLDLSGEDVTTPGETEPSGAESIIAASYHHQSHPSIQETAVDLEEDQQDFLWNGSTYLKTEDAELTWPYNKEKNKAWDLNLIGDKPSLSMISPKSGCSDQPAMWSSSEHLSCFSDIASKCSADIDNFCDQLCNLPELKRVSFSSSENGGPESMSSNPKLSDIDSTEENSEALEDVGIENVFTRDFYRLVKFESSKSLTASSKSLATSEGFLTLDKLKNRDALQDGESLSSVLGFIAEQQKYCKHREIMDESSYTARDNCFPDISCMVQINTALPSSETDSHFSPDSLESAKRKDQVDNSGYVLPSSESLSCLDLDVNNSYMPINELLETLPPKPKRSTSLNLGMKMTVSYKPRCMLTTLPSSCSPPQVPSRSSSRTTLPNNFRQVCKGSSQYHHQNANAIVSAPPPPAPVGDDCYVEPYHTLPVKITPASLPPAVPPHRTPVVPLRTSSKFQLINGSCASPPVPKRITSRALPLPPADRKIPTRTTSLGHSKVSQKLHRPRSLLKEVAETRAMTKVQKQRGSCGDLAPICRSSATLMFELEKMAKAEEEEKCKSGKCDHVAMTPNEEVGLGTGWVRVEPFTDFGDAQTRANLLDTMLQSSSEGCSSEADEDLAKQLQRNELLKAVQGNRRKRKALRHNNSEPSRVIGWRYTSRPSILGCHSMFSESGKKNESSLQQFQFLDGLESQSEVGYHDDLIMSESDDSDLEFPLNSCLSHSPQNYAFEQPQQPPQLKDLRSSEPCQDLQNTSLHENMRKGEGLYSSTTSLPYSFQPSTQKKQFFFQQNKSVTVSNPSHFTHNCDTCSTHWRKVKKDLSPLYVGGKETPDLEIAPQQMTAIYDNSVSDDCTVKECGSYHASVPQTKVPYMPRSSLLRQSLPSGTYKYSEAAEDLPSCISQTKCQKANNSNVSRGMLLANHRATTYCQQQNMDGIDVSVDTRSLCPVKATIQKLSDNIRSSQNYTKSNSLVRTSSKIPGLKAASFSTKRNNNKESTSEAPEHPSQSPSTVNYLLRGFEGEPLSGSSLPSRRRANESANEVLTAISSKNPSSFHDSKLTRRLSPNSSSLINSKIPLVRATKSIDAPLPVKATRKATEYSSPSSRLPKSCGMARTLLFRSPKFSRLKLLKNRFGKTVSCRPSCGKRLCDSGSSEGSEKGCSCTKRLSISDSCAEVLSQGESGDEVSQRVK